MHETGKDFSFNNLFVPLTTRKCIAFLIAISFFIFFGGFFNGFVGDDNTQILDNPAIQQLQNVPLFLFENRLTTGQNNALGAYYFRPIDDMYLTLIYAFAGPNPTAYHFFQIVLYVTSTVFLFLFFKKLFGLNIAFLLALVFLIHPINDEEMFYISATQDVLFFFFGIWSLWLLINIKNPKQLVFPVLLMFLSILSKETGVLFLICGIFYVLIFKRKLLFPILGITAIGGVVYTLLRIHSVGIFSKSPLINAPIQKLGLIQRLINIPAIIFFYTKTLFYPQALSSSWQWIVITIDFWNFFLPLILDTIFLVIIALGAFLLNKKKPNKHFLWYLFFCFWFLIGILFHLQILPLDQTVAERWFYFPFFGILGMVGVLFNTYNLNLKNKWVLLTLATVIICLSLRTFARSIDFKNDFILATHDVKVSPDSYNLEYIISHMYYVRGDLPDAKKHALASIRLFPYITNYTNLGATYSRMGDYENAKKAYLQATKYGTDALPYENLGALALAYGDPVENIDFIKNIGLKKYPNDGMMWYTLAVLEYTNGNKNSALYDIKNAKLYFKNSNVNFIYSVIANNKRLKLIIKNGGISYVVD